MRVTTITVTVIMALTLVGCSAPPPPVPIPIETQGESVPAVDVSDLPPLTAPQECAGYVALTFDDGPTPLTGELLDILDHYDVPAAFFNLGIHEEEFPHLVARMIEEGHQVGNHTMTHADLSSLSVEDALAEIDAASSAHRKSGHGDPRYFRPPYGQTSPEIREGIEDRGMTEVLWTADTKDYEAESAEQVVEAARGMSDGGILLMHDGKPLTVTALPEIIRSYYDEDLCFGPVASTDQELPTDLGITHAARANEENPAS